MVNMPRPQYLINNEPIRHAPNVLSIAAKAVQIKHHIDRSIAAEKAEVWQKKLHIQKSISNFDATVIYPLFSIKKKSTCSSFSQNSLKIYFSPVPVASSTGGVASELSVGAGKSLNNSSSPEVFCSSQNVDIPSSAARTPVFSVQ